MLPVSGNDTAIPIPIPAGEEMHDTDTDTSPQAAHMIRYRYRAGPFTIPSRYQPQLNSTSVTVLQVWKVQSKSPKKLTLAMLSLMQMIGRPLLTCAGRASTFSHEL